MSKLRKSRPHPKNPRHDFVVLLELPNDQVNFHMKSWPSYLIEFFGAKWSAFGQFWKAMYLLYIAVGRCSFGHKHKLDRVVSKPVALFWIEYENISHRLFVPKIDRVFFKLN